jgi:aryl-alcohol dehydrogenase-like predicted oxidoreductase
MPTTAALAWVAQLPGVSTVIPGARTPQQARSNAAAGSAAPLPPEFTQGVRDIYDRYFAKELASKW